MDEITKEFTLGGTPVRLLLAVEEDPAARGRPALTRATFTDEAGETGEAGEAVPPWFAEAERQLREYFAGERTSFDLDLRTRGSEFQERVWAELETIPYGRTISYGELATRIGAPRDRIRAVAAAVGANPLAIVRPCHRVIGADGSLTGYAGGLERKRALLTLEGALQPQLI